MNKERIFKRYEKLCLDVSNRVHLLAQEPVDTPDSPWELHSTLKGLDIYINRTPEKIKQPPILKATISFEDIPFKRIIEYISNSHHRKDFDEYIDQVVDLDFDGNNCVLTYESMLSSYGILSRYLLCARSIQWISPSECVLCSSSVLPFNDQEKSQSLLFSYLGDEDQYFSFLKENYGDQLEFLIGSNDNRKLAFLHMGGYSIIEKESGECFVSFLLQADLRLHKMYKELQNDIVASYIECLQRILLKLLDIDPSAPINTQNDFGIENPLQLLAYRDKSTEMKEIGDYMLKTLEPSMLDKQIDATKKRISEMEKYIFECSNICEFDVGKVHYCANTIVLPFSVDTVLKYLRDYKNLSTISCFAISNLQEVLCKEDVSVLVGKKESKEDSVLGIYYPQMTLQTYPSVAYFSTSSCLSESSSLIFDSVLMSILPDEANNSVYVWMAVEMPLESKCSSSKVLVNPFLDSAYNDIVDIQIFTPKTDVVEEVEEDIEICPPLLESSFWTGLSSMLISRMKAL